MSTILNFLIIVILCILISIGISVAVVAIYNSSFTPYKEQAENLAKINTYLSELIVGYSA